MFTPLVSRKKNNKISSLMTHNTIVEIICKYWYDAVTFYLYWIERKNKYMSIEKQMLTHYSQWNDRTITSENYARIRNQYICVRNQFMWVTKKWIALFNIWSEWCRLIDYNRHEARYQAYVLCYQSYLGCYLCDKNYGKWVHRFHIIFITIISTKR